MGVEIRMPRWTLSGGTLSGGTLSGGTLSGGTLSGGTLSGGTLSGGTLSGGTLCLRSITPGHGTKWGDVTLVHTRHRWQTIRRIQRAPKQNTYWCWYSQCPRRCTTRWSCSWWYAMLSLSVQNYYTPVCIIKIFVYPINFIIWRSFRNPHLQTTIHGPHQCRVIHQAD